ncbi:MAG: formylglycine-generating enzyme family protein [Planctomycetes bacterium]|nr:formylglycine-generating enzyme family protein [Planctomycetota bacterium]
MKRTLPVVLMGAGVWALGVLSAAGPPEGRKAADAPKAGTVITNSLGMKLAYIPAGKFQMGSPADEPERTDAELRHEVAITQPFYMGIYEVTQREFNPLMAATVKRGAIFDERRGGGPDHPMENVTWRNAVAFCDTLSGLAEEKQAGRRYRLPTEAEWEYACRAGTTTPLHFGKSLSAQQANFNGNSPYGGAEKGPYLRKTAKVGSFKPNAWGLYDMHGNVAEWCADYYDKDYYRKSPREDPKGPDKGVVSTDYNDFYRVIRGGCWLDEARACRSAYRFRAMPHDPYRLIGFRVVCEVPPSKP